jgi:TetR/AcrR family transcriptional repressor of bet genes
MPRPSNTVERREQIVQGLMTAMSEFGYEGATIPAIAQAAGLTPGLVHYHFNSKQAILIALIDHLSEMVRKRFSSLLDKSRRKDELTAYIQAHLALGPGADHRAVTCWIVVGAEAVRQPDIRSAYQTATAQQILWLEQICTTALKEQGRSTKASRRLALAIISAIEGAYRLTISAPDFIPAGFAAKAVIEMASGLIAAQPKSNSAK